MSCSGIPDYGFGRCDGHHEMVDLRLRKSPRERQCDGASTPSRPLTPRAAVCYRWHYSKAKGGLCHDTLGDTIGFLAFCSFPVMGPALAQSGEGWITLFDGKNLDHWQGDGNANFAIDDGSIVAKDKKDPKATAFLISKDKYKDFQVYAEFWVSNDANSGIFIRCEDPKKPSARTCYECNIFDTRPDPSYGTGAIVYHAEVNPMPKAGGKWSTMEITAKGRDL